MSTDRRPTALLFDLYHTLVDLDSLPGWGSKERANALGLPYDLFVARWHHYEPARLRSLSVEDVLVKICEETGGDASGIPLVLERYLELHRTLLMKPDPEVTTALETLRADGFPLGLVTNCVPEEATLLEEGPFNRLFDCVVASCRVGLLKPEEEIYRAACSALSVSPESCWFIGDGGSDELTGARRLGMTTVHVTGFISPEEQELGRSQNPDHSIRHVSQLHELLDGWCPRNMPAD